MIQEDNYNCLLIHTQIAILKEIRNYLILIYLKSKKCKEDNAQWQKKNKNWSFDRKMI